MKQFNLEEYLKNPSKKVVTRDGRKVKRLLCTDAKITFPLIALIEATPGSTMECLRTYTKDGNFFIDQISPNDLFFATEKHEGYVNVYRNREHLWCGDIKRTETEAKEIEEIRFSIATIKIEWEE